MDQKEYKFKHVKRHNISGFKIAIKTEYPVYSLVFANTDVFYPFQVRVYTAKRVVQELESAKEEYIRATFGVRKDHKILLPKVVESFAKDSGLCPAGVMEMIQQSLPESLRKSIKKCQAVKSRKNIEWVPHNFTFRYLISKELVK